MTNQTNQTQEPHRCTRCGDTQAAPGTWFGDGDIWDDGTIQRGGLGPCGDLHSWE